MMSGNDDLRDVAEAAIDWLTGRIDEYELLDDEDRDSDGSEAEDIRRNHAELRIFQQWLAEHPADGGEPWDLAWLFDQGADVQGRFDLGGEFYIQFYRSDMKPTLNHEYPGVMNSTLEEYIELAPCPTKSDVLDLLRVMGFKKPEVERAE